ncbi:DUF421 domain-containing protein, partial [Enterobacter hormaechei]|uniref:DUF421 domain-containing protein n=1 Tax=Enterobacter hormaechei TaxID=158836 RepID=UPI000BB9B1A6
MDMVFRALAIYLFLVIVFKVAGRRALLQMTSFDLILLLIISEATQQALLGEDFSVTGAMITITTLVVVDIFLGLIKKYSPSVENVLDGTPGILVEYGIPSVHELEKVPVSCYHMLVPALQNHWITK